MTLVAQFGVNGAPLVVGDVLLSSSGPMRVKTNLPLVGDINGLLESRGHPFQVTFKQKLNLLNERLVVGWCGSALQAERALRVLQRISNSPNLSSNLIGSELMAVQPSAIDELQLVGVLLGEVENGRRIAHYFSWGVERTEAPQFGNVFAAGTGRESFLQLLGQADWTNSMTGNEYQIGHALLGALTNQEYRTGNTIANRWGGGFEAVTCSQSTGRFEKIGDVLHTFWKLTEGNEDTVDLVPMFYKTAYRQDALVIRSARLERGSDGGLKAVTNDLDVVPPLLKEASDYDLTELEPVDFSYRAICCHVLVQKKHGQDILFFVEQRADHLDAALVLDDANSRLHISASIIEAIKVEHSKSVSHER